MSPPYTIRLFRLLIAVLACIATFALSHWGQPTYAGSSLHQCGTGGISSLNVGRNAPTSLGAFAPTSSGSSSLKTVVPWQGRNATITVVKRVSPSLGTCPPAGTNDDPYTNFRLAPHTLRSATILIGRLPLVYPYLRLRLGAVPSSPRDPPLLLA